MRWNILRLEWKAWITNTPLIIPEILTAAVVFLLVALFTCGSCTVAWLPAVLQEFLRDPVKQQEAWGSRGNHRKLLPLTAAIQLAPNVLNTSAGIFRLSHHIPFLFVQWSSRSYYLSSGWPCAHTESVYVVCCCCSTGFSGFMELFLIWCRLIGGIGWVSCEVFKVPDLTWGALNSTFSFHGCFISTTQLELHNTKTDSISCIGDPKQGIYLFYPSYIRYKPGGLPFSIQPHICRLPIYFFWTIWHCLCACWAAFACKSSAFIGSYKRGQDFLWKASTAPPCPQG